MKRHLFSMCDHTHRWRIISFFIVSVALLGYQVVYAQQLKPSSTIPQDKPSPVKAKKLSELPTAVREELDRLASDDAGKRATAIVSLAEMGQEAIPAIPFLIGALGDSREVFSLKGRSTVNNLAVQTLENLGEPARQSLLDAIQAENRDREWIMWALGKMKEPRAVEPLIHLLSDEKLCVVAIHSLGELGDPRAVEPLLHLLSDENYRSRVVIALGDIGDPRAVEPLLPLLSNKNDRGNAAIALGKLKDPRAVEPLIAALKAGYYEYQVAEALGHLKDPRAIEPLIDALKNSNMNRAQDALKEITGQDLSTSDDWSRWWEQNKKTK
jgi:HEAT repeat protein